MFVVLQLKRKFRALSMMETYMAGYSSASHIVVLLKMALRPKAKKRTSGDALIRELTTPRDKFGGDIAGARAMNMSIWSFSCGWMDNVAKA